MDIRETAETQLSGSVSTVIERAGSELKYQSTEQDIVERVLRSERERIAAYLHDEVLQSFAVCSLKAQLCERIAQTQQHELLGKELVRLEDLLVDSIDKVRGLIGTLAY